MKREPKEYRYNTTIEWTGERKGTLSSKDKPDWDVACGPEFGGHPGFWTPEDLFVASVEHCSMSTYLWLAERDGLPLVSYRSEAEGLATMSEGSLRFTEIKIIAKVIVPDDSLIGKAWELFDRIGMYCLVHRSVKTEITIQREVHVEEKD